MYKNLIITTYFLVSTISACEFINGVTIQEPKVSCLFNKASSACLANPDASEEVEELYIQYLCLIAQYGEHEAHFKRGGWIIEQIKAFIQGAS